jgi:glutamate-1-semialdehyde aminotransferase/spore coat polysaccharide biosynthesis protein SpsF (cytidylyltransferase family)
VKNIVAIVQARMGSTRFPNKVMQLIDEVPLIEILLHRLSKSQQINKIILATSKDPRNQPLIDHVKTLGYSVYQGSENDVLDRYYQAAREAQATEIVRITGDCPLISPDLVDQVIKLFHSEKADYASNTNPPTYPDGLDISVCTFKALEAAWSQADTDFDREHVMPFIINSDEFHIVNLSNSKDFSKERWTIDEPEDLNVIKCIFGYFAPRIDFSWQEIMQLRNSHPEIFMENQHLVRNEGSVIGTGQKLWKRAKRVIPGGNMLLSKRPEMFLPNQWPAYYSKAKGCKVWDLDGKEYIDMSIMGIGTNTLGYGHPEVDEAVIKTVKDGNMATFNCPEEVYLAEKLVELHPWADMVRFSRAGGEINSIAIRIARASTGKDKIAICGYHGWHDWYLSANLNSDKNLDGHLLPGLQPNGVPRGLTGTTLPFNYNDIEQLERLIKENNGKVAAIKMEVSRNEGPKDNYLQKVRDLATENNIILIFDECTSGFRETFGGLHKKYGVEPDIAIFAKALGNGYAISACIGRQEFMQAAQQTFISSTFWTERVGPTAALKTLEVMEREKSWETITKIGNGISSQWQSLADKHELDISTWGLPALSGYTFNSPNALSYKTLITQEMLKKGYLAANSVYACIEHKQEIVDGYFVELEPIFATIKECEDGLDINSLLEGPLCHSGFKRLN